MRRVSTTLSLRLILYFLCVMFIPFIIFVSYTFLKFNRGMEGALIAQTESALEHDADALSYIIEEYRHKAYMLSSSPLILSILEEDDPESQSHSLRDIYNTLYVTMAGDTYKAIASIVSLSGRIRVSTHDFPEVYDLRIHNNEWDSTNIITLARQRTMRERASIISINDHRIENGRQVLFSILRRTFSEDGRVTGFVIIDVLIDDIITEINKSNLFSDVVLIDNESYTAISLIHPQRYGDYSEFPFLRDREKDNDTYEAAIAGTTLSLVATNINPVIKENARAWAIIVFICFAIGITISVILSLIFSHSISKPLGSLVKSMKSIQKGNFETKLERTGIKEFDELAVTFNVMVKRIERLLEKTREEEAKSAEAERKALESQMNPHFLFNTLNTIKALAKMHGEIEIYQTTLKLGKLLRSSIDNRKPVASIRESIDLVECYLSIQKLRFGEKLEYTIDCPEELLDIETPKLILQPIVENAVTHGLSEKIGDWKIGISIRMEGEKLIMSVKDNGVGFDHIPDMASLENGQHTGLYNVYRRLELKYGKAFSMKIESEKGNGTFVVITIPGVEDEEA